MVDGRTPQQRSADYAHVESLVHTVEVLTRKISRADAFPIELLDRYARALAAAHASNLVRLQTYDLAAEVNYDR